MPLGELSPPSESPSAWPPAAAPAERELWLLNSKGERLHGVFLDTGSQDVVVLCHG